MLYDKNDDPLNAARGVMNGLLMASVAWAIAFFLLYAFVEGIDKEIARQETVNQYHCQQYADDIASWANKKGIQNPCTTTN